MGPSSETLQTLIVCYRICSFIFFFLCQSKNTFYNSLRWSKTHKTLHKLRFYLQVQNSVAGGCQDIQRNLLQQYPNRKSDHLHSLKFIRNGKNDDKICFRSVSAIQTSLTWEAAQCFSQQQGCLTVTIQQISVFHNETGTCYIYIIYHYWIQTSHV